MIKTIVNCEDVAGCEVLHENPVKVSPNTPGTESESTISSCQFPMESTVHQNLSFSNEISFCKSCTIMKNRRKGNFRQRIRSLREECVDGPLLASAEDLAETDDDTGFIVAHRSKRGKKVRGEINAKEEPEVSVSLSSNPIHATTKQDLNVSRLFANDPVRCQNLLECLRERYPDLKECEYQALLQTAEKQVTNINKLSNDELYEELEKLREEQIKSKEKEKNRNAENLTSKRGWVEVSPRTNRVHDFDECAICYTPWDANEKKILVECGHCFHSHCLSAWMKLKRTCPFCSGYSLSPDDFPELT